MKIRDKKKFTKKFQGGAGIFPEGIFPRTY